MSEFINKDEYVDLKGAEDGERVMSICMQTRHEIHPEPPPEVKRYDVYVYHIDSTCSPSRKARSQDTASEPTD